MRRMLRCGRRPSERGRGELGHCVSWRHRGIVAGWQAATLDQMVGRLLHCNPYVLLRLGMRAKGPKSLFARVPSQGNNQHELRSTIWEG